MIISKKNIPADYVKTLAQKFGFDACGIAPARHLYEYEKYLKSWLNDGYHGEMHYMKNHFSKRLDPQKLVDGAKSVIVFLSNYYPNPRHTQQSNFKIATYALGKDYHFVIKDKLFAVFNALQKNNKAIQGRCFVDSAPVLEKVWAQQAGLGWIGKNTNLLTKKGSFFFISEIITNFEFEYDSPFEKDYCGNCTKCMDACPTNAIEKPYILNANKCISYLTIEKKGELPKEYQNKFENQIFGCDICQEVCPWNKKAIAHQTPAFKPNSELLAMSDKDWENIDKEKFQQLFRKSAVKRNKFSGLYRNINYIKNKGADP